MEATLDSARFFAVRVVGDGGRKAVLGIGFEERGEAIDFGITLQEVRKVQKIGIETGMKKGMMGKMGVEKEVLKEKKDFSLKVGETIHVDLGKKFRPRTADVVGERDEDKERALFSIAPPPYIAKPEVVQETPWLLPPPGGLSVKAERRRSRPDLPAAVGSASDLGFDDGEFGEFQ